MKVFAGIFALVLPLFSSLAPAQTAMDETVFRNVRVFDGTSGTLSAPESVLVRGNEIAAIGVAASSPNATVIEGGGRTLMPGLIDAHTHLMFASVPQVVVLTSDIGFINLAAGKAATEMLMRGYTSVRDLGGPIFGLKRAVDTGLVAGPRIWPSGAFISQSGGHGDFRLPTELPAPPATSVTAKRLEARRSPMTRTRCGSVPGSNWRWALRRSS
jgi:imidazolonepropionase-like amidohydrolase